MKKLLVVTIVCSFLMSACTWVRVTSEGAGVRVYTAAQAQGCERLGQTHSRTQPKVLFFKRSQRKQKEELESLAKNEAAVMGGNVVAAQGEMVEGRQTFTIYKCQ